MERRMPRLTPLQIDVLHEAKARKDKRARDIERTLLSRKEYQGTYINVPRTIKSLERRGLL